MFVFLKRTPTWSPQVHTFLFKVFLCLLTHIYVVKCIHAPKFCSIVYFCKHKSKWDGQYTVLGKGNSKAKVLLQATLLRQYMRKFYQI